MVTWGPCCAGRRRYRSDIGSVGRRRILRSDGCVRKDTAQLRCDGRRASRSRYREALNPRCVANRNCGIIGRAPGSGAGQVLLTIV